jgi:DNA-binding MarR family transcriptional regulator
MRKEKRMATAYQSLEEPVLRSRSFTLSTPPLTTIEKFALEHCENQARAGQPVTQASITDAIGSSNVAGSTAAGVLNRLDAKGYIERRAFQRGVQVCIVATGQCTAPPPCTVPHWRTISDNAPVPAIQHLRSRDMSLAQWIETTARSLGRDYLDFAMELLKRGAQDFKADQEG